VKKALSGILSGLHRAGQACKKADIARDDVYAKPRNVSGMEDIYFYHTMDLPAVGTVHGEWDLRGREASYLGNVDFRGKTVLELGTASGHICFYMEKQGASVTAYDLSSEYEWDVVPYAGFGCRQYSADRKRTIDSMNRGFWLAHRLNGSKARVVYGTVYQIPHGIGQFDISVFGDILLHVRDPFLALQQGLQHTKETVIIIERMTRFDAPSDSRVMRFLPDASACDPRETWWQLTPELLTEFTRVLGFERRQLSYHTQLYMGNELELFTLVADRQRR
jgi:hypothetical protein